MEPSVKHLTKAIKAAENAYLYKYKHGAIIYDKKGTIISSGFNKKRSSACLGKYGYFNCWHHAESDSVLKALRAGYDLRGCSILVIRIGRNKLCNSKPCSHCVAILLDVGITDIWYSTRQGEIKEMELS